MPATGPENAFWGVFWLDRAYLAGWWPINIIALVPMWYLHTMLFGRKTTKSLK